jgi:hypothetical protein
VRVPVQSDIFSRKAVSVKVDVSKVRRCGVCKSRLAGDDRELCKACWLNPDV